MKRLIRYSLLPALVFSAGCASFPEHLKVWENEKLLRLAMCAAKKPKSRKEGVKCMGPDYSRDLGDEASATVHLWLAHLPDGRLNEGKDDGSSD